MPQKYSFVKTMGRFRLTNLTWHAVEHSPITGGDAGSYGQA